MTKKTNSNSASGKRSASAKGNLFIVSAPSGAGKTTMCRALRRQIPDLRYSISYTTRAPRPGEENGIDYHFIAQDEFKDRLARGQWAEWAEVYGNYYGTDARFLEKAISAGEDVLLDIDVQGAGQIVNRFSDSVTIFIMPPSMDTLAKRLTQRGTASAEDTKRRLDSAAAEIAQKDRYRHIIVNDDLNKAVSELTALVASYRKHRIIPDAFTPESATGPA